MTALGLKDRIRFTGPLDAAAMCCRLTASHVFVMPSAIENNPIKNESGEVKQWILSLEKRDRVFYEQAKGQTRLIVGYSESRAKKDRYNRDKGVRRLEKDYKGGKIAKENLMW